MKTYSILKALSFQLSLYNLASGFAVAVPDPAPVQEQSLDVRDSNLDVVLPAGWAFLGCFTDQTDPTRTLATQTTLYGLDVTIELCIDTCIGLGFNYAGLESGFQCFCGDVTNSPGTNVDSGCDTPCAGNDAELCGGALRLSVYVNQAVNGPSATGAVPTTTAAATTSSTLSISTTELLPTTTSISSTSTIPLISTTLPLLTTTTTEIAPVTTTVPVVETTTLPNGSATVITSEVQTTIVPGTATSAAFAAAARPTLDQAAHANAIRRRHQRQDTDEERQLRNEHQAKSLEKLKEHTD